MGKRIVDEWSRPKDWAKKKMPTRIGYEMYPNGYYNGEPCICTPRCTAGGCRGQCGCDACHDNYMDFGY